MPFVSTMLKLAARAVDRVRPAAPGPVTIGSRTHFRAMLEGLPPGEVVDELDRSIDLIGGRADHFPYPKAQAPTPEAEDAVRHRLVSPALAGTPAIPSGMDGHRRRRSPIQTTEGVRLFRRKVARELRFDADLRQVVDRTRDAGAAS